LLTPTTILTVPAHHLPRGSGCSGKLHKETWDVLTIHGNCHGLETGGFDRFPTVTTTEVSPDLGEFTEILDDVSVKMIPLRYC
jgi:hypothetical protein